MQFLRQVFLNSRYQVRLILGGEADRCADAAGPSGASDAMDVVLRVQRQVVIDYVADIFDMNTPAGHVCRYHHCYFARTEVLDRPYPLLLRDFAGEHCAIDPMSPEPIRQYASLITAVAENEDTLEVLLRDEVVQEGEPFLAFDKVYHLLDGIDGHLLGMDINCNGVVRPLRCEPGHLGRKRGAEEHGLPFRPGRRAVHDLPYVGDKTHIQHLVGFVYDQYLDLAQVYDTLILEIQQPPWCGHNYIDHVLRQHLFLSLVVHPAEHGNNFESAVFPQQVGLLSYLQGKFARGGHYQGARHAAMALFARKAAFQVRKDGDQEGGGLAGAGLRLARGILSCEGLGQYRGLDRGAIFKTYVGDPVHDLCWQAKVMEACLALGRCYLKLRWIPSGHGRLITCFGE